MSKFFKDLKEKSRFFSRNTTPKIVSIIFALVMWLYVMGEVNPEMVKEFTGVRVQLLNVETLRQSGLVLIDQEDYTVSVKINGRRNDVYNIRPQDVVISADLRGFQKGVNSVPLKVNAPASIKYDIYPNELEIKLDEVVKRQKPVEIVAIGTPPEGFDPGEAEVSLKEIIVEGPDTLVRKVEKVVGEVNFDNKTEDFTGKVPLKAVDLEGKAVSGVEVKTKYVDVSLPLYSVKEVRVAIDLTGKILEGYEVSNLSVKPEFVGIKGKKEIIKGITEIKSKSINIEGLVGSTERTVELIVPEGVTLFKSDRTPVVSITVEEVEQKEITYQKEDITIENLDNKYKASLDEGIDNIRVRIEAPKSVINSLSEGDIQLHVNLKGFGEGRHSVKIIPTAIKAVKNISVIPEKIDVEMKPNQDVNQ